MTLRDYLQSEQAREDVRNLLCAPVPYRCDAEAKLWIGRLTDNAWTRVEVYIGDAKATAYYRPDGDRYIVTDLGEGVRAFRLRTGALGILQRQIAEVLNGIPTFGVIAVGDALYKAVKDALLPDALCRFMLASLRVSEVAS